MALTATLVFIIIVGFILFRRNARRKNRWLAPKEPFAAPWRIILMSHVPFYNALADEEKSWFEHKVQKFLLNCRITGIQTGVDTTDKLLVASSAVIPIFEFKNWSYTNIHEVLLYPSEFNEKFETEGDDRYILGMVGTGYMDGTMILSKPALRHGFQNELDRRGSQT